MALLVRQLLRALALILLLMPVQVSAESVTLQPDQALQLAKEAIQHGDPRLARAICLALLQRDPQDSEAARILSAAEDLLGNDDAARKAANLAWTSAKNDAERFAAARQRALADYHANRHTTAQWWLRRAAQVAPTEDAREAARANYRSVQSQNPWITDIRISVAPSSNINNGSSSDTLVLAGIPFTLSGDARALSGTEASLGFTARYRLLPTPTSATELRFSAFGRAYQLSSEARAQAPNARGSDYAFAALEAGMVHQYRPANSRNRYDFAATLGHNWYGGQSLSNYLRLEFGVDRTLNQRTGAKLTFSTERQLRSDNHLRSATVLELGGAVNHVLQGGDRIGFRLGLRDTQSDSADIDHRAVLAGVNWTRGEPVAGMRLSAGLSAERRDYSYSRFTFDGRQDTKISADVSVVFENIQYYGFSPSADLRISRTKSNISLYETEDIGLSIGFKSSF